MTRRETFVMTLARRCSAHVGASSGGPAGRRRLAGFGGRAGGSRGGAGGGGAEAWQVCSICAHLQLRGAGDRLDIDGRGSPRLSEQRARLR